MTEIWLNVAELEMYDVMCRMSLAASSHISSLKTLSPKRHFKRWRVRYKVESCVHGHHVFQLCLEPLDRKQLVCQREVNNTQDAYAVAVMYGPQLSAIDIGSVYDFFGSL